MDKFFKPKSVAVIGVSRDPNKVGHVIFKNLLDSDYKGKVYAVNPKTDNIGEHKCYGNVNSIHDNIDLAVIAVPSSVVLKVIEDCGKKKIKNVVIVTAGFSESGNNKLEEKLLELLRKFKIKMIGPNVLGIFDAYSGLDTLFLPRLRLNRPDKGTISFICQSGAVGSATMDLVSREGYGFAKFISYGNASQLNECDFLEYLNKDKETKVICMYIEGIKDGKRFMKVAKKVKKPIIALKGGLSNSGMKAALSHTASLAGNFEVYKGAFKQAGIIWADNLEDLFNYAKVLEKTIKPKGNKVQVITNGGGYGIICADEIEQNCLGMAELSEKTKEKLKNKMNPLVVIKNPMDLIGDADTKRYEIAIEECLNDKNVDILLVVVLYQTPLINSDIVEIISELNSLKKKPIVCVSTGGNFTDIHSKELEKLGVPCFVYTNNAVRAIRALVEYYKK